MTRTFWLSFCDGRRPKGHQFLGVAVVDVTEDDAAAAALELALRFPNAQDGAELVAASTMIAHREGCNPGGEVASLDITDLCEKELLARTPRNTLLQRTDLEALGHL